jgi:two-component system NtrC family sensor kinase
MKVSFRGKLVLIFLIVIALSGAITVWTGVRLIGNEIVDRAQDKVRLDLNSARLLYWQSQENLTAVVRLNAQRFFLREGLVSGRMDALKQEIERVRVAEGLDILSVTDEHGKVIFRSRNPEVSGDSQAGDEIIAAALSTLKAASGTQIMTAGELAREGASLAERARMKLIETRKARQMSEAGIEAREETSGMVMKAAVPILNERGTLVGLLYGGKLLNRDSTIVDAVKEVVYQGESYRGRDMGTATIFQDDLRISTNVLDADGRRAVGTRVSREVYDRVIVGGEPWIGRAFVVNQWYITAYEPLKSLNGNTIGMLYVGMLEKPYVDLRRKVVLTFSGISIITFMLLSVIVYSATSNVIRPLKRLLEATHKIASGYLNYRVEVTSDDELGQLASSFNSMTEQLESTAGKYESLTRTLEDRVKHKTLELEEAQEQLIQSEKLTSLGKMAAGIAHEINNPLTSILLNSHLMAESMGEGKEPDASLKLILDETERCSKIVKGLLDFSRQSPAELVSVDVNGLIGETLELMKSHLLASKVQVDLNLAGGLAPISADPGKIKQVATNLIHNAVEAMPDGGKLTISSRLCCEGERVGIEFADTGCGISAGIMKKIFDPFFSTKKGKGTGLGLSITYGIVEQHGGTISVASEVGKGTTVKVSLPVRVQAGRERVPPAGR